MEPRDAQGEAGYERAMPTFSGKNAERRSIPHPPERAARAFAELDRQLSCHPELAAGEPVGSDTLRIRLKEMSHGPVQFAGHYTLTFTTEGTTVRWQSGPDGNVTIRGEARFTPAPGGCEMQIEESCTMEMDINRLVAGVVRPIAETMMARGMKGFVKRMADSLSAM